MQEAARIRGAEPAAEEQSLQVVGLMVAEEEYAIDILEIVAVERFEKVVQLPRMPESVAGLMSIRDEIVPLIELRRRFGFDERGHDLDTRVVVIRLGDLTIGLVADSVTRVYRLSREAIQEAPPMALSIDSRFVRGVLRLSAAQILVFLDPQKIISEEKVPEISRARSLAQHYVEAEEP